MRYRSGEEDSARWLGFSPRQGDVVVSTRSKHGTTWTQVVCLLLLLQTPELPAPLAQLSPWLDWTGAPLDAVLDGLEAQPGRRVVKTHTPLDGLPLDPRVAHVVVARHPLDAAVSLYHQGDNLDRERLRALTGKPVQTGPRPTLDLWLTDWVEGAADPRVELDSLPGVLHHLGGAWALRDDPRVVLLHYDDLQADLDGQMRALATRLGVEVAPQVWPDLVRAAGFPAMRERAARLAPDPGGVLKDRAAFFRQGRSGAGRVQLSAAELDRYRERAAALAPADLLAWLHRDPPARISGPLRT